MALIRLAYEDLVADYPAEIGRLFEALGLDAIVDPVPPTQRQADEISGSLRVERPNPDGQGARLVLVIGGG